MRINILSSLILVLTLSTFTAMADDLLPAGDTGSTQETISGDTGGTSDTEVTPVNVTPEEMDTPPAE